jgi:choline transport protein
MRRLPNTIKLHPTLLLPVNALALVFTISIILSLIYVASTTAFNAIISLQAMALSLSYIPPILFILIRKLQGRQPPYGPFKLGRWGVPTNLLALMYLVFVIIWMPFPQFLPVTGSNMNYAGPLLGAVILGALIDWVVGGRRRFQVPMLNRLAG